MDRNQSWTMLRRLAPAVLVALVAAGPARAEFSPELKAVIEAAKKEGALALVWGEGTFGGSSGAKLYEQQMNAMFGTDLRITFTPGASMPQVGNDIAVRQAAGQPSPTDVYIGYADVLSRLAPRKPFLATDWGKLLPGRITAAVVDENGANLKVVTALPGIAYNSKLAPSKPEKLVDLLRPEWKGKIAATPYAANFDVLAATDMWGHDKALDFARKMSAQASGLMRCNEGERLATGEFLAFAITCSGTDFIDTVRKGAPIVQIPPADFPALGYFYLGVPKNAAHPNAGKLYALFCLTPEGQKLVRQTWDTDLDLFAETGTHKIVADLEAARGEKFHRIDIAWYEAHPEAYAAWKEIEKIFTANNRVAGPTGLGAVRQAAMARRVNPAPGIMLGMVIAASAVIVAMLTTVLWLGFRVGDLGDPAAHWGLGNYREIFGERESYTVLANTFGFAAVTLAVSLIFGVPLAWLVERTDLPGKTAIFTLMTVGLLLPGFASAMGWLFLMHPQIGMLHTWLGAPVFDIASMAGMGWVQGLNLAPVAFIMTAAVFRATDPALEEAAQVAGAGFARIMTSITLRLAWPGILAAAIYIFMIGFAAFDVPAIIGWGSRHFTFSTYLVLQLDSTKGLPRYGMAATLSSVLVALGIGLSWWYSRIQRHAHRYQVVTGKAYRPRLVALGRAVWLAWGFAGLYILLSQFIPLALVVWASLLPYFQLPTAAAFASLSLQQYSTLPWQLAREGIVNTAILMVLTPTVTLAFSVAFSWVVLRTRLAGRSGFDVIAFLPHAVPSIVFGVSALLIALFVLGPVLPLFGTIWILLGVFVVTRISYGTRMTNSGLIQIHRELEEAATIAGAGTGAVLWRVLRPLLAPTLLYAWLWIALLVYRELTLAVVLTTRENITLPVVVWSLWLNGGLGQASALALVMLLAMLPIVALYWYMVRRRGGLAPG